MPKSKENFSFQNILDAHVLKYAEDKPVLEKLYEFAKKSDWEIKALQDNPSRLRVLLKNHVYPVDNVLLEEKVKKNVIDQIIDGKVKILEVMRLSDDQFSEFEKEKIPDSWEERVPSFLEKICRERENKKNTGKEKL